LAGLYGLVTWTTGHGHGSCVLFLDKIEFLNHDARKQVWCFPHCGGCWFSVLTWVLLESLDCLFLDFGWTGMRRSCGRAYPYMMICCMCLPNMMPLFLELLFLQNLKGVPADPELYKICLVKVCTLLDHDFL
jgi:hypothetical protein